MRRLILIGASLVLSFAFTGYLFWYAIPKILWNDNHCFFHDKESNWFVDTFFIAEGHIDFTISSMIASVCISLVITYFISRR